jgi:hypothetical protein
MYCGLVWKRFEGKRLTGGQRWLLKQSLTTMSAASTPAPSVLPMALELARARIDIDGSGYLIADVPTSPPSTPLSPTLACQPSSPTLVGDEVSKVAEADLPQS